GRRSTPRRASPKFTSSLWKPSRKARGASRFSTRARSKSRTPRSSRAGGSSSRARKATAGACRILRSTIKLRLTFRSPVGAIDAVELGELERDHVVRRLAHELLLLRRGRVARDDIRRRLRVLDVGDGVHREELPRLVVEAVVAPELCIEFLGIATNHTLVYQRSGASLGRRPQKHAADHRARVR